ncbi:TauD/TfdA family dioxygenase [Streptomyces sp. NPDC019937]|uniref:TauD/TfdA family dioxygenase n=1 Tax=Streptomyces sp. NPDC019937 TaxID=3154787 RepID=UPI0033CE9DA8
MKITDYLGNVLTRPQVMPTLAMDGIIHVSDTDRRDFMEHLSSLLTIFPHPHAADDGWTLLHPLRKTSAAIDEMGFTNAGLPPHTDRSLLHTPPSLLCFLLMECPSSGGITTLVDTASVYRRFNIEELLTIQSELLLEDPRGGIRQQILTIDDIFCMNRYRADRVAVPVARSRRAQFLFDELQQKIRHPAHIELHPGQGYVIHNHRFLHGRTKFTGPRTSARLLATVADESMYRWMNRGFSIHQ